ncbi:MAG: N-6 DNA methylase, partial [Tepidisphaeraceae bacterium]
MDRRNLYKLVAELLPRAGGPEALLNAVADLMRGNKGPENAISGELRPLCNGDDALGQIYQAINAPALEAAYRATARDRRKFTAAEIPAVTQLFTPKWVVEFLLQNTLGKLWIDVHPDTRLHRQWKWLAHACVARMGETPMPRAIDLRICDPACGTMNFGLVALDMLRQIYREEMHRAGQPGWPQRPSCSAEDEIDDRIIEHNLIGFDIDPVAIDLARRSLEIKIGKPIVEGKHRLEVRDALFDKKIGGGFDVVVTNPPYLSARNLDPAVVRRLKSRYPAGWRDLYACLVLRALELLRPGGRTGILCMQSFMFTAAFERMRRQISEQALVQAVAHFGPGLFDIGNPGTLQTAAAVLRRKPAADYPAVFYRLVDAKEKRAALARAIRTSDRFELRQDELASLPRSAWMYWISPAVRRVFHDFPKLGEIAPPRQGLATTDNMRFVRYWWEVEPPGFSGPREKWMPYAKGGRFRRWYESARHRVNWENNGREIKASIVERYPYLDGQWQWVAKNSAWYGREGITYSYLTSGSFSARRLESGTIFDVAGSSLFPDDPLAMLGLLTSAVAGDLLSAINPTVNFQV